MAKNVYTAEELDQDGYKVKEAYSDINVGFSTELLLLIKDGELFSSMKTLKGLYTRPDALSARA